MSRRNSRILAFQALYSWDVSKASLEDLLTFSWLQKDSETTSENESVENESTNDVSDGLDVEEKTFAGLLISGTIDHLEEIDQMITSHLSPKWSFERINKVTLAILRTSIYEMKFMAGSVQNIVIDEAVTIAKRYGADDAFKFVNAILDNIGKEK